MSPMENPVENEALNHTSEATDIRKEHHSFNINHYAIKKSAAQSMLDVALLMANSSQLKTVLHTGPDKCFYIPLIVLISISILLQIIVGLLLVFIVKFDLNDIGKQSKLNKMNNAATITVFFIVLVNIFIAALGFESARSDTAISQSNSFGIIPNST